MTPELRLACQRAVHVVTGQGKVLRAGRAVLFALREIGWVWTARLLSIPPLIWCVELGYAVVARHRKLFARFLFRTEYPVPPELEGDPEQAWTRESLSSKPPTPSDG